MNRAQQLTFQYAFTSNSASGIWEKQVKFAEKEAIFWLYRTVKFAVQYHFPGTFSLNDILHYGKFLIEIMLAETEIILSEKNEFCLSRRFMQISTFENIFVSGFRSEEPDTKFHSQLTFCKCTQKKFKET